MQLHDLTLTELGAGLSAKKFSSRDVVDALLRRVVHQQVVAVAAIDISAPLRIGILANPSGRTAE